MKRNPNEKTYKERVAQKNERRKERAQRTAEWQKQKKLEQK